MGNTVKLTVSLPVSLEAEVTDIHAALLAAVQGQVPVLVVTIMLPLAPPAIAFDVFELIKYVHPDACVTVNVWSAKVMVPVLAGPTFCATVYSTVMALPELTTPPPLITIHASLLAALHRQVASGVRVTWADDPALSNEALAGAIA